MNLKEFDNFLYTNSVLDCEDVAVCWQRLRKEIELLRHIQANGVDNWEGYSSPPYKEEDDE
jgi:hypothetical protein